MKYSFCPKCGHALTTGLIDDKIRMVCTYCRFVFYQNSKPCASVLVLKDGQVLLIQRGIEPYKGYWDIPGGFLEDGEHPHDGAQREIYEETGLHINIIDDLGVFMGLYGPSGERDHTLNFCYVAKISGGQAQARSDATALQWFKLDTLPVNIAFDDWSLAALELLKQQYG